MLAPSVIITTAGHPIYFEARIFEGFPTQTTLSGISCITMLPDPITTLFPIETPGLKE